MAITPGTNNFLTFAEQGNVPEMVMDDKTYKECIRRQTGFAAGEPADNALMNTALKNISLAMKGFTDFIATNGVNVSQSVEAEEIRNGLQLAITNMIEDQVMKVVRPLLQEMNEKIDAYAAACHGVPVGGILPISCSEEELEQFLKDYPAFAVCDGLNGTVNLSDRFIVCASPNRKQGSMGGTVSFENLEMQETRLTEEHMPRHHHEVPGSMDVYSVEKWPFGAPIGSTTYIGSPEDSEGFRAYSSFAGKGRGHSHKLIDSSPNKEGMLPPYYALIFVQKIRKY